ncbi:hypothetical protein OE749_16485, partial [Aestuariibacter sp. AA17]|nr:hypothetical protein [Aestuariibacter sp. AA17]
WEGRFKSQALLNERAVLACMAYVDLNPIRAGIASTLENSDYTSIKRRLCSRETKRLPFKGYMDTVFEEEGVSISLKEYEKLLLLSCSAIKSFGINKTLQLEFIKQVFDASELCIDHGKVTYGLQPNQLSNLNPYQDKAG